MQRLEVSCVVRHTHTHIYICIYIHVYICIYIYLYHYRNCVTVFIPYSVGRKIVTKRHDKDDDDGDTDMEDITSQYKNPEGNLNFHPVKG